MEGGCLRKFRGDLSQKELSELLCVAPSTLSRIEKGTRTCPPGLAARWALLRRDPRILFWYCEGCPVRKAMPKHERFRREGFELIKGGKAA